MSSSSRLTWIVLILFVVMPASHPAVAAVKKFHLYATDGWLSLADGSRIYIWGFSDQPVKGSATLPSPTLVVNEGDQVELTLTNIGFEAPIPDPPHTIHLHGLDVDQANDGVPFTSTGVQEGDSITYRFTATQAGTYWYHCHVTTVQHLQMGMYGAFIVHAANGKRVDAGFAYDREYAWVLSEIDPGPHDATFDHRTYDKTAYHPRYFLINGRSLPDVLDEPADHLEGALGQKILLRLINAGYQMHAIHSHGYHFQVIAPGERYDLLVIPDQVGTYPIHDHFTLSDTNNGLDPGGMFSTIHVIDEPTPKLAPGSVLWHPLEGLGSVTHPVQADAGADAGNTESTRVAPQREPASARDEVVIHARLNQFHPDALKVKAGATVTWVNDDLLSRHDIQIDLGDGGKANSPGLRHGEQWSYTFEKPGRYRYICTIHEGMRGVVVVEGATN